MSTEKRDAMDGDYVGNVFGWKLSLWGGALILALVVLAMARHYYLDVPTGFDDPLAPPVDTTEMIDEPR